MYQRKGFDGDMGVVEVGHMLFCVTVDLLLWDSSWTPTVFKKCKLNFEIWDGIVACVVG